MASKISNFITKILLGLLLVIMIAGVAVWGINDILVGNNNKTVAKVGNSKVSEFELQNIVQNNKLRMVQSGLTNISEEFTAVLRNNALVNLIGDRLLQNEFAKLNLQLDGKEILKKDYLSQPDFNKESLGAYVRSQGGEEAFLKSIIKEKKIDILQGSLTAINPVSDVAVRGLFDFENQTKKIEYLELSPYIIKDVGTPGEDELQAFYESNKDNFLTPEYRSASYITIDKNSVKLSGGEDIIEKLHTVSGEVLDKVAGGATLEEIAKEYDFTISQISSVDSEGKAKDSSKSVDLPKVKNFTVAIFATEQGEISDLLESDDGKTYAFVKVDNISEKRIKTIEEVKDLVIEGLKTKKKAEKLVELSKKLKEDLDLGKTSLQKFAAEYGTSVKQAEIKSRSKTFSPELTKDIMSVKKGGYSNLGMGAGGELIIAKVIDVSKAESPSEMTLFEYRSKVQEQISQEIMAQYLDYLKGKYNVTVYSK